MAPTRRYPTHEKCSSLGEQFAKGVNRMGRIFCITAAFLLLTTSWVCAGNFEVLANAGAIGPAAPIYIPPGALVKAQFKADMRATSDIETDADLGLADRISTPTPPKVQARPAAAAVKDKRVRGMAPPPRLSAPPAGPNFEKMAAGKDEDTVDLEADLEKDLVISPPPAKTEDQIEAQKKAIQSKPVMEKKAVSEKATEKKAAPAVKKMAPVQAPSYAVSQKPIQKVKTTKDNSWARPAGAHVNRACPVGQDCYTQVPASARGSYQPMVPPYMSSGPRTSAAPAGKADRIVRDGVTIKLAPAAAAPAEMYAPDDSASSDILSTAAEIIGLPFAFLSSFF